MATKRKADELNEVNAAVLKYLQEQNLGETAKIFAKEAKLKGVSTEKAADIKTLYNNFVQSNQSTQPTKKAKTEQPSAKSVPMEEDSSSSSSDSSDSDSDSDSDKKPAAAPVKAAAATKPAAAKKDSSSSSSDSSDSDDSEDEKAPAKPAPAAQKKAAPAAVAKKADSSSSDSSSSDSSSDESEKKPAAKAQPAAKAAPAKPASDSSSDSSDSSDSEDEKPKPAAKATPAAKAAPAKKVSSSSSSSSSSSDSDNDSDSDDEKPAPVAAKKAAPAPAAAANKKKAESSSSSSSSSDDSSSSSSSDEEEEKPVVKKTPAKQENKAAPKAEVVTPKSAGNGNVFKIYVKGLPWQASEEEVRDFFKDCGDITSCELPLDENGRSSGTAYVKFAERAGLDAALALDGQTWQDTSRWLKIVESSDKQDRKSFGGPVGERPEGCDTVFVGNLPWDVDEDSMRALFAEAGEVSNVRFATAEDGSFRGFGHVQFYNGEDTVKAIALAGRQINGRAVRVDYAPPRNRESFGGQKSPGGGRGGRGGGRGGFEGGRGGRGGGRGGSATTPNKKNAGVAVSGSGKKTTFDD